MPKSVLFSDINYRAYLEQVYAAAKANPILRFDLTARKTKSDELGVPFSIVRLHCKITRTLRYFAVSKIFMAPPGTFGRIKIAFPLLIDKEKQRAQLQLSSPLALKVLTIPETFKGAMTADSVEFMQEKFADKFATLKRDEIPEGEKRYYPLPLYKKCLIDYLECNCQKLSVGETLLILYKIALALRAIHEKGYVHLDIKPDNIMIRKNDTHLSVYIVDFDSITKVRAPTGKVGTEIYMPPELAGLAKEEEIAAGPEQDIFSLGGLFEACVDGASSDLLEMPVYAPVLNALTKLHEKMQSRAPLSRTRLDVIILKLESRIHALKIAVPPDYPPEFRASPFDEGRDVEFAVDIIPSEKELKEGPWSYFSSPHKPPLAAAARAAQPDVMASSGAGLPPRQLYPSPVKPVAPPVLAPSFLDKVAAALLTQDHSSLSRSPQSKRRRVGSPTHGSASPNDSGFVASSGSGDSSKTGSPE